MQHRRPLGRGRQLAAVSALAILVGCLLPWYAVGGSGGLPVVTVNAFSGAGLLVFLAAIATLALVTLPYAAGDRPVPWAERWTSYLILAAVAGLGILLFLIQFVGRDLAGLRPDHAPGLWLALVGVIGLSRGTFEIYQMPEQR
jgi:hypothetical protein